MTTSAVSLPLTKWRDCVSPQLWLRLISRIQREQSCTREVAERIMSSACEYLELCALHPERSHVPSKAVDIGWHAFLMYTKEYAAFCQQLAGRFIHHCPNDGNIITSANSSQTADFMSSHGITFDAEMWNSSGQCTTSCHPSNDCGSGDCNSDSNA